MRFAIAISLMSFSVAGWAADVGEIKTVQGAAHVERGAERLAARTGMPVRESDRLVTGEDGSLGVTFADNSLLSIGPNSALAIDRYVFDSTTYAGQFDSTLSQGTLTAVSGRIVKQSPEAMRVRTPSAIMGVRGTQFAVRVDQPKR